MHAVLTGTAVGTDDPTKADDKEIKPSAVFVQKVNARRAASRVLAIVSGNLKQRRPSADVCTNKGTTFPRVIESARAVRATLYFDSLF